MRNFGQSILDVMVSSKVTTEAVLLCNLRYALLQEKTDEVRMASITLQLMREAAPDQLSGRNYAIEC